MKTFSLWIIIHLVFLSILGILSVQMSLYHSEILDFKSPFSVDSGFKSQFNLIISKERERRPLFYGHFTPYRGSASHLRQTYGTASFQHRTFGKNLSAMLSCGARSFAPSILNPILLRRYSKITLPIVTRNSPFIIRKSTRPTGPRHSMAYPAVPGILKNLQTGLVKSLRKQRSKQNPSHLERLTGTEYRLYSVDRFPLFTN